MPPFANAALLVVDVQNDFCDGGALPVAQGQSVVPVLNTYIERFRAAGRPVVASRDWHPARTTHFAAFGGVWPAHCVQGTVGAAFHSALRLPSDAVVVSKGLGDQEDAYSAFQARRDDGAGLAELLRRAGVRHLYIGGLATDYCVRSSVLDALRDGFLATVLLDGSRGVNLQPHDAEAALEAMIDAGAAAITLARFESAAH